MSKHTAGPWHVGSDGANIYTEGVVGAIAVTHGMPQEREADAQRIVECVNALEGVEDPEAFMHAVTDLLHHDHSGELQVSQNAAWETLWNKLQDLYWGVNK